MSSKTEAARLRAEIASEEDRFAQTQRSLRNAREARDKAVEAVEQRLATHQATQARLRGLKEQLAALEVGA